MDTPHKMTPLSKVMEKLRVKKIEQEWKWTAEGFMLDNGKVYQPSEMIILKTYRFEGYTDPSDTAILYVIEANDGTIGYSIDAYGVYSDHEGEDGYNNFIRQVPEKGHEEQLLFEI